MSLVKLPPLNTVMPPVKTLGAALPRETWLPFTERLLLKPDLVYLAQSALLSRLVVGMARSASNHPKLITDDQLSPPQKQQAFIESCFKELFGTPSYMLMMHLGADVMGWLLQKTGWLRSALKPVSGVSATQLNQANHLLNQLTGQKGIAGKVVFNADTLSLTHYTQQLTQQGLAPVLKNPAFAAQLEQMFKRLKLAGSMGFVAQMLVNIAYGGFFVQQFNDKVVAPYLERTLYKPKALKAEGSAPA
jgi:hypothetical protein